ncbi:MAG TPA: fumarylacetoacetate hydrolase family protein [Vicinamibacterales bacterium]|nr:fumarylacetoacetate hydrolase family protein [Vicinamibacterales bacterium]
MDARAAALRLRDAYAARQPAPTPSSEDPGFDLAAAYAVERELVRMRRERGHRTGGRKVGYANKAMWRVLKLDTLVWAHMYDDTVHYAARGTATLSIAPMYSPKIEPEIVFKLRTPLADVNGDPSAALASVEWLALGFEIIDAVYPDWKFQPADFVAAYGLHAALIVGEPAPVDPAAIASLVEKLPSFKATLLKNGEVAEEGSGKNSLRSPALCLAELAAAVSRQPDADPLAAGELISSGTLTTSLPIAAGETWRAEVEGLDLAPLTLRT